MSVVDKECIRRQEITIELAHEFKRRHKARKCTFEPVGVAQGWSPKSYAIAVRKLQRMGYTRVALGGMVPLKTPDILSVLKAVAAVRRQEVQVHLLGVTRTEHVEAFDGFGVTSFDTTSPFLRAFKDAKQNYFTAKGAFTALRIPQVQGNARVENLIRSGAIDQLKARRLEQTCLARLRDYDAEKESLERVLEPLLEYERLVGVEASGRSDRRAAYVRTLTERPWATCPCEVCRTIGVEVIIFRGSERNKRRGFHNLYVLYERLHHELAHMTRNVTRAGTREAAAIGAATWQQGTI
jgi:hypothetical protein